MFPQSRTYFSLEFRRGGGRKSKNGEPIGAASPKTYYEGSRKLVLMIEIYFLLLVNYRPTKFVEGEGNDHSFPVSKLRCPQRGQR